VSKWWYLAISVIVAILFSCYLVYHIQLVMGGKKVAISPDEYVFASVQASGRRWWSVGWAEDDGQSRQPAPLLLAGLAPWAAMAGSCDTGGSKPD
jgi:hypothetical protein